MTIEEAKNLKTQTEGAIHDLILKFNEETGLKISGISIVMESGYGRKGPIPISIKIITEPI